MSQCLSEILADPLSHLLLLLLYLSLVAAVVAPLSDDVNKEEEEECRLGSTWREKHF